MKGYLGFIIGVFTVIAAIAVGFWLFTGGDKDTNTQDLMTEEQTETESVEESTTEPEISEPMSGILTSDQWSYTEQTEEDLSEALEEGQKINWVIPIEELGMAYFTTSLPDGDSTLISVYEYNLDDYSFNRIYKRTINSATFANMNDMMPTVRVVAFDAGTLYFLVQPVDDSPGPCAEPLLLADESPERSLLSLSISDPLSGWQRVEELPAELRQQAEQRQSACLAENGLN